MNLKTLCIIAILWAVSVTTYVVVRPASSDPQQAATILSLQQNNEALQKQLTDLTAELKKQTELMKREEEARKKQGNFSGGAYMGPVAGGKRF